MVCRKDEVPRIVRCCDETRRRSDEYFEWWKAATGSPPKETDNG